MNKLVLVIAGPAMLFFSCKKGSNPTNTPKTSIVGKWYYAKDTLKQYNKGSLQYSYTTVSTSDYLQFNSDGTGVAGTVITLKFTYAITGNTITLNTPEQTVNEPGSGTYTADATIEKATIKTLTSSNLELYFDDKNDDGTEDTEAAYFTK